MAIMPFLAMTAAEMRTFSPLPPKTAWMACHFSPYGLGLSNLPRDLPPGSVLLVDDITPPHGHDPVCIAEQLTYVVEEFQCGSVLLDFQRDPSEETRAIAAHLASALPCPTAVSERYAGNLDCPVFLSPVPLSVTLHDHLAPWKDREVWLELSLAGERLTLTESGCDALSLPCPNPDAAGLEEETLHCHYSIAATEKSASFTLWRTVEDLNTLLTEAEELGVAGAVGLYQELWKQSLHPEM